MKVESGVAPVGPEAIEEFERLGRLGWPALHDEPIAGWSAGASGAYTRRANCVATSFASGESADLEVAIGAAESFYRARGLPAVFKLTEASASSLDSMLAARGYSTDGETLVETLDLEAMTQVPAGGHRIEITSGPVPIAWFEASTRLSNVKSSSRADYAALLEHCRSTQRVVLFGHAERNGAIVSLAMASIIESTVSIAQVATDPELRGQGLAASVLRALLFASREHDAESGLLSVEAPNASARRLYERLGFIERYRYWYREAPPAPESTSAAAESSRDR